MGGETVKVIVRCRPMNTREKDLKCKCSVDMDGRLGQCRITNPADTKGPPKAFTFDGAYFTDSTTENIYADIAYPLVEGVTEGYNGTIFAYGQTGCGKSFSMQGITDPATQRGIIPRAFDHVFETIHVAEGTKYLVHASFLEIYNEEIRDLLGKNVKTKLDLKEHPDRGVYVQNLSMHPCKNTIDCERIMKQGWDNRSTGSTLMNADSSRSHSIFTIHMERCDQDEAGEEHIRAAKLNLVDLAGSERQAKTGATGDRLKEATKINLSLSALGNVISALVDGKSKHIPYRDSKLTRLLQDSLGGNTKTLMVACLSPADNNYDETLSTLRYANRAKNIKNKPKINEDPKDALLREYQEEINKLKAMLRGEIPLEDLGPGAPPTGGRPVAAVKGQQQAGQVSEQVVHVADEEKLEEEKTRIREEYEQKMIEMRDQYEEMRISKDKMQEEITKLREHYDLEMATVEEKASHIPSPGQVDSRTGEPVQQGPATVAIAIAQDSVIVTPEGTVVDADGEVVEGAFLAPDGQVMLEVPAPTTSQQEYISSEVTGEEAEMLRMQHVEGQQAVHIATRREDITLSPREEELLHGQVTSQSEAAQKLHELQAAMVGGEEKDNEEVKERRKKKKVPTATLR